MSFLKYLNEGRSSRTPDGYPIRGGFNGLLRAEEAAELPLSFDAHCRVFDLSNQEHLKEYEEVLDRIANEQYIRLAKDLEMADLERKTWLVLCRWAEVKGDIPPNLLAALGAST